MTGIETSLFSWASTLYARPGIKECMLTLQDKFGANVCLAFALLRLSERGVYVHPELVNEMHSMVDGWAGEVTVALRTARKLVPVSNTKPLEGNKKHVREAILSAELEAERALMDELDHVIDKHAVATNDVGRRNIAEFATDNLQFAVASFTDKTARREFDRIIAELARLCEDTILRSYTKIEMH
ncbi:MAG: TIGR02444 family protein [Pseudomonadota bacterium]